MPVIPFRADPRLLAMFAPLFIAAAALVVGLALRNLIDRFLDEDDPRRQLIAQALLYGGTFVVIAVSGVVEAPRAMMFGEGFEQSTIRRTGPDGLTRVITRTSWAERESVLVEAREAELLVFRRWEEFHRKALGFMPSWEAYRV